MANYRTDGGQVDYETSLQIKENTDHTGNLFTTTNEVYDKREREAKKARMEALLEIAGMGGAVETLGNYSRFMYSGFTNHGWDGIMLAVLCRNKPKAIPVAAFFLAYLKTSADSLNLTSKIPPEIISVIQAIIIIFVAAERFLGKWEHRKIVANSQKALTFEKGE